MKIEKCCAVEPKTIFANFGNEKSIIIYCAKCHKSTKLQWHKDREKAKAEAERSWNELIRSSWISPKRINRAIKTLEHYAETSHQILKNSEKNKNLLRDNIAFNDAIEILNYYLKEVSEDDN